MPEKMLKFVNVGMQMPSKREHGVEPKILKQSMIDSFMQKPKNNLADVHNAGSLFGRFTALYIIIFLIG